MDGAEKFFATIIVCFMCLGVFVMLLERQEKFDKIEQMKQLIEIKQGIELKLLLEETDSLITEMEDSHGR